MLKRKALLIGCSNVPPELPGVIEDLKRYKNFLASNNGGAWNTNEIITSLNDDNDNILNKFKLLNNADFVFMLIAGHGEHRIFNNDEYDSRSGTYYYHNKNRITEPILVGLLFPRVKRSLIIVDVCRKKEYFEDLKKSVREGFFSSMESGDVLSREAYRSIYDDTIANCPEARIVAYSCSQNQEAGDNGNGGIFSRALLNSYKPDGSGRIVNIKQAFDYTQKYVNDNNYPQMPLLEGGRGRVFFPFALT